MSDGVRWIGFFVGLALTLYTASSVIRSLVVPRGLTSFIASGCTRATRKVFLSVANRFETY